VLEEDDISKSEEALDELWVRRNNYDPSDDLRSFKAPFLSILGGDNFVVPHRENRAKFRGHKQQSLGYERLTGKWHSYFKFDRVTPGALG